MPFLQYFSSTSSHRFVFSPRAWSKHRKPRFHSWKELWRIKQRTWLRPNTRRALIPEKWWNYRFRNVVLQCLTCVMIDSLISFWSKVFSQKKGTLGPYWKWATTRCEALNLWKIIVKTKLFLWHVGFYTCWTIRWWHVCLSDGAGQEHLEGLNQSLDKQLESARGHIPHRGEDGVNSQHARYGKKKHWKPAISKSDFPSGCQMVVLNIVDRFKSGEIADLKHQLACWKPKNSPLHCHSLADWLMETIRRSMENCLPFCFCCFADQPFV